MISLITKTLKESAELKLAMIDACAVSIERAVELIAGCIAGGGKLLVFGNGGSAADAQHMAAEIVGRFYLERTGLPAMALTTNTSILTAVGNDYGFDRIFARQVEALAQPIDVVLGISTSGSSANVVEGLREARDIGCRTIALTGSKGCPMDEYADVSVKIPSEDTPRIQEGHAATVHVICLLVEKKLAMAATADHFAD